MREACLVHLESLPTQYAARRGMTVAPVARIRRSQAMDPSSSAWLPPGFQVLLQHVVEAH